MNRRSHVEEAGLPPWELDNSTGLSRRFALASMERPFLHVELQKGVPLHQIVTLWPDLTP
jgi:hypothetical protein